MILVVPAHEPGRGGGHLVRCTKLVSELQALGKETRIYNASNYANEHEWNTELIILDRFQTPKEELEKWKALAPVIGIDEGGASRDEFDFLIDILPNLEKIKANITDIGLLSLPAKEPHAEAQRRRGTQGKFKILVSFGMEDQAALGNKVFNELKNNKDLDITFLNKENKIENLSEHLHEYDLVITHFGITAFEAVYAGTSVLLVNPTQYHEKLAKKAGFKTIKNLKKISASLRLCERSFAEKIKPKSLAQLISSFCPQITRHCPVCGEPTPARALQRFPDRTYRKCKKCGVIYMDRLTRVPFTYGKEYFFEEYKKQYGKSYLEDFPNLLKAAKNRLDVIGIFIKKGEGRREKGSVPLFENNICYYQDKNSNKSSLLPAPCSLLDIGCAYGAFLAAAKEEGYEVYGIDPCKEAVEYVTETLGLQATHGFFPSPQSLVPSPFNIITLWFTLEHFQDCKPVFKEINNLLSHKGILAFSTPAFSGISGRKNLYKFLQNCPADHYTIWSPKMCKKALSLYGFKVKKIVNCGHHPERFPILGKLSCCHWLLMLISKMFKLGDTFEVFAIKN